MTWSKVIGQERIKKVLQRTIIDGRIPHAYCFWGRDGVGKEALAIEFAKTVNCSNPVIVGETIDYCGKCNSCRIFSTLSHPNLQFIFATPAAKSDSNDNPDDKQIDEITNQLKQKSGNYYHKIQVPGGSQIRISSVRQIKRSLSMSAGMSGRRVVIVSRADELTLESANAFLKTLEEPQENTTIILVTSKKETLLPTILSRCQLINVPALNDNEIIEFVKKNIGATEAEAGIIAAYADGSVSKAIEFNNSDIQILRLECVELLRIALTPKIFKQNLIKRIDDLTNDKDKRKIEYLLNLIIIWMMDVIKLKNENLSDFIINKDLYTTLKKFTDAFGNTNIDEAIKLAESAIIRIKRNVPLNLILLDLFIHIRNLFLNKTAV